jgi:hypothetical protein
MRAAIAVRAETKAYYAQAAAWGYGRREAQLVLYGVMHMARQELRPIDVLAEARQLLATGEVPHS